MGTLWVPAGHPLFGAILVFQFECTLRALLVALSRSLCESFEDHLFVCHHRQGSSKRHVSCQYAALVHTPFVMRKATAARVSKLTSKIKATRACSLIRIQNSEISWVTCQVCGIQPRLPLHRQGHSPPLLPATRIYSCFSTWGIGKKGTLDLIQ